MCSNSFTIWGLWVLGLAVSNINESQLQTYESKPLFLMTSLQYYCIPGLAEIKSYVQKMQDAQVTKSLVWKWLIYTVLLGLWPWTLCHGDQNLTNSSPSPNIVSMQVWSKSIHWFRRWCKEPYFGHYKVPVWPWKLGQGHQNLKKKLFPSSHKLIDASFVNIYPLVHL